MKVLFLFLLLMIEILPQGYYYAAATVSGVTPFKTMDFEEGDGSDLTSVGSNTTFHGDAAHLGSYGMRITSSSSTVNYYTFASAKDEVWMTFWIYVPDATTFSGSAYSYSSWFYDGSTTATLSIFGGHANDIGGGVYKWNTWMMGSYDATFADNSTNFSRGAWHKIKVYYKKGTGANSVHKIWVDDTLALDVTTGNRTGNTEGYSICIYQPSATGYIYWDDFKFYDEDPGTQD
jgi:hypothetical protein